MPEVREQFCYVCLRTTGTMITEETTDFLRGTWALPGFEGPDANGVYWRGTAWRRFLCGECAKGPFVPSPMPVPSAATTSPRQDSGQGLDSRCWLCHVVVVRPPAGATLAQRIYVPDDNLVLWPRFICSKCTARPHDGPDVQALKTSLQRAHDAIRVLYFGDRARRPDGSVDVDAVINGVLGEP